MRKINFRLFLGAILAAVGIMTFDAIFFALFFWTSNFLRNLFPSIRILPTICLYLSILFSIIIIAFVAGLFLLGDDIIIRLGIMLYISYNLYMSIIHHIHTASLVDNNQKQFVLIIVYESILLLSGIIIASPLYRTGIKFRNWLPKIKMRIMEKKWGQRDC